MYGVKLSLPDELSGASTPEPTAVSRALRAAIFSARRRRRRFTAVGGGVGQRLGAIDEGVDPPRQ